MSYPSPQIAAGGFSNETEDLAAVNKFLVVTRDSTGRVYSNYWDTASWTTNIEPSIKGTSKEIWEAIALVNAEDLMFYGLTNDGNIKSFTIDRTSPFNWMLSRVVVGAS